MWLEVNYERRDIADNWKSGISFNPATFVYVSKANTMISIGKLWYFCFQWFEVRGECSLCWSWWNFWSPLLTISFHNIQFMHRMVTTKCISYKICSHTNMCISYWLESFVVFFFIQYLYSVIKYQVYVYVTW
jgi:hypothetical protein